MERNYRALKSLRVSFNATGSLPAKSKQKACCQPRSHHSCLRVASRMNGKKAPNVCKFSGFEAEVTVRSFCRFSSGNCGEKSCMEKLSYRLDLRQFFQATQTHQDLLKKINASIRLSLSDIIDIRYFSSKYYLISRENTNKLPSFRAMKSRGNNLKTLIDGRENTQSIPLAPLVINKHYRIKTQFLSNTAKCSLLKYWPT